MKTSDFPIDFSILSNTEVNPLLKSSKFSLLSSTLISTKLLSSSQIFIFRSLYVQFNSFSIKLKYSLLSIWNDMTFQRFSYSTNITQL